MNQRKDKEEQKNKNGEDLRKIVFIGIERKEI
jgi:hypothetical protein